MTALLDRLAPDWREKNPIRADDKDNSFGANKDGWQDHGPGGQKGDQITFLQKFKELSRGDAVRLFLEMAGVETAHKNGHVAKSNPVPAKVEWSACVEAFTADHISKLAEWRGLTVEFVQWLKLRALVGIYKGKLALPEHDPETGTLTGIHYLVGKLEDKEWRRIKDTPAQPLVIGDPKAATWLVFESQWDAFTVMEQTKFHKDEAIYCVLITRGASNGKFTSIIPAQAEAIVVMQNDVEKEGAVKAEDWLEEINQHCPARLRVARPPRDLQDCNDWLKRGDANFYEMLAKAEAVTSERPCLDWIDFDAEQESLPDALEIVKGMIRRGEKASLGGSSKSKKTFTGLDLVLSVASGKPWMGIETAKVPVVIVDMELRKKTLQLRIKKILEVRGIILNRGELYIISLRGKVTTPENTLAYVKANSPKDAGLFFIDPFYKLNSRRDENHAGDITFVMNLIDNLGREFDAAILYSAHYSKGNQAGKDAIDRISGSGVYGRDADTIISMTAHQELDCFTIEPIFRSFAPMEPWVVRWNYPLMERADELDPAKLKKAPGMFETTFSLDQLTGLIGTQTMTSSEIERQCWNKYKMSDSTVKRLLKTALLKGKVEKLKIGLWKGVMA